MSAGGEGLTDHARTGSIRALFFTPLFEMSLR